MFISILLYRFKSDGSYNKFSDYMIDMIPYFFFLIVLDVFILVLLDKVSVNKVICNIVILLLFTIVGINL